MSLRLLVYSCPGGPALELSDQISDFFDIPLLTIENESSNGDSYFDDKIPETTLDAGDMTSGSASQQAARDFSSADKEKSLDRVLSIGGPFESLTDEEMIEVNKIRQGVVVSQCPDTRLVAWATHVCFLNVSDKFAIDWFSKRRKCPSCGSVFHLTERPPKKENLCDRCGTDLIVKPEDDPNFVKRQFTEWRTAFWRLEKKAKEKGHFRVFSVEKFETFHDLVVAVSRMYQSFIEDDSQWKYDIAKDSRGYGLGPVKNNLLI